MRAEKSLLSKRPKIQRAPCGISVTLDLYGCHPDLICSEMHIREYAQKLGELLGLKTYGACHVVHFGESLSSSGFSMFQLVDAFSISAHFVSQSQAGYIDIFTCKPFDEKSAALFSQDFFEAKKCKVKKNIRQ